MFNFKRLTVYIWYIQRIIYLNRYKTYATTNLNYFKNIRLENPSRQNIGLKDLNMHKLPRVNQKKEKMIIGNSQYVMESILVEIKSEYNKLDRWLKWNKNMKNTTRQQAQRVAPDGLNHCLIYHIERGDKLIKNNFEGNIEKYIYWAHHF